MKYFHIYSDAATKKYVDKTNTWNATYTKVATLNADNLSVDVNFELSDVASVILKLNNLLLKFTATGSQNDRPLVLFYDSNISSLYTIGIISSNFTSTSYQPKILNGVIKNFPIEFSRINGGIEFLTSNIGYPSITSHTATQSNNVSKIAYKSYDGLMTIDSGSIDVYIQFID